jgi:lipoate---protein ligase
MLCISHPVTDPYFTIATEEYLLKNFSDDIFMLYRNEPSVIVGKHQNTFGEVNYWYVKQHHIKVVRRLSGGGTVFHDDGNLNFCFIRNGEEGNLIDFKKFTQPIIDVLQKLGVPAERSGRNDLMINGLKFSGNAEHVYKNRTLHHGTLLFSSQLGNLAEALKVKPYLYTDKAVKSVRSQVTNIMGHLPHPMGIQEFEDEIIDHVTTRYNDVVPYQLTEDDKKGITRLAEEKYGTWEWNFGYSPRFVFRNQGIIRDVTVEIELEVEKGIIKKGKICLDKQVIPEISKALPGQIYREDEIQKSLREITSLEADPILWLLF